MDIHAFKQNSFYIYECEYQTYLNQRIDNEQRLLRMLNSKLNLRESVMLEAATGDKIKAKWNKLVEFLKGLFAKFMESMSNILLSNKEYLEKYKDIILNKQPKPDIEFSYTGNYPKGIERITKVEIPVFQYSTYQDNLLQDSDGPIAKQIIPDADFNYDENEGLSSSLKVYFCGGDGQTEGKLDDGTLNFTDMYNFCHDWEKVKKIVNTDQNRITSSTTQINQLITNEIKQANDKANQAANANQNNTNPANTEGENKTGETKPENDDVKIIDGRQKKYNATTNQWEDTPAQIAADKKKKAEEDKKKAEEEKNGVAESAFLELEIKNTSAPSQASSTGSNQSNTTIEKETNKDGAAANIKKAGESVEDAINRVNRITDKWGNVCRAIVGAKLTATEQIAKDYMAIIREHVRSYGGEDPKNKTNNKAKQAGTDYGKKDQNNQKQDNKDLEQNNNQQQ